MYCLFFHGNSGYANAPHCEIARTFFYLVCFDFRPPTLHLNGFDELEDCVVCLIEVGVLFSGHKKVHCTKQKFSFELGEDIQREQFCE